MSSSTKSACRAKDPRTCPYHGSGIASSGSARLDRARLLVESNEGSVDELIAAENEYYGTPAGIGYLRKEAAAYRNQGDQSAARTWEERAELYEAKNEEFAVAEQNILRERSMDPSRDIAERSKYASRLLRHADSDNINAYCEEFSSEEEFPSDIISSLSSDTERVRRALDTLDSEGWDLETEPENVLAYQILRDDAEEREASFRKEWKRDVKRDDRWDDEDIALAYEADDPKRFSLLNPNL